jgi:hypothetical protein
VRLRAQDRREKERQELRDLVGKNLLVRGGRLPETARRS